MAIEKIKIKNCNLTWHHNQEIFEIYTSESLLEIQSTLKKNITTPTKLGGSYSFHSSVSFPKKEFETRFPGCKRKRVGYQYYIIEERYLNNYIDHSIARYIPREDLYVYDYNTSFNPMTDKHISVYYNANNLSKPYEALQRGVKIVLLEDLCKLEDIRDGAELTKDTFCTIARLLGSNIEEDKNIALQIMNGIHEKYIPYLSILAVKYGYNYQCKGAGISAKYFMKKLRKHKESLSWAEDISKILIWK